jgi:glucose-1-phosphate thymidylyltransferase
MRINTQRKGIILSGGNGTRLNPITSVLSKQLLPIYDKPMIYYPLSTLMLAEIRQILIISTADHITFFQQMFGNGSHLGMEIQYKIQPNPEGLAQAFILGEEFLDKNLSALILGDNIFYGNSLKKTLLDANDNAEMSSIFAYSVNNPKAFGVVEFDDKKNVVSIEEKPLIPKSNFAVTGLYFYDNNVSKLAKTLKPSDRGELEITDLNNLYIKESKLKTVLLSEDFNWFDTGTFESLLGAANFVQKTQKETNGVLSCLEYIAFQNNWINEDQVLEQLKKIGKNSYSDFIKKILKK